VACGLVTEIGEIVDNYKRHWFYKKELNLINLKEEVGDLLWYLAVGYYALDLPIPDQPWEDIAELEVPSKDLIIAKLTRYAMNPLAVALSVPEEVLESNLDYDLRQLLYFLHYFSILHGFTLMEAATDNIIKLKKRFPEGYTQFHVLNRNVANELSHIKV